MRARKVKFLNESRRMEVILDCKHFEKEDWKQKKFYEVITFVQEFIIKSGLRVFISNIPRNYSERKLTEKYFAQINFSYTFALPKLRPVRLGVRTPGFHPGNRGSIPLRATKLNFKTLQVKHLQGFWFL